MVRVAACAALLSLAAARCGAAGNSVYEEPPIDYQDAPVSPEAVQPEQVETAGEAEAFQAPMHHNSAGQWITRLWRGVYRHLTMQQRLARDLLEDLQWYFDDLVGSSEAEEADIAHVSAVRETVETIQQRMTATSSSMEALSSGAEGQDGSALRTSLGKFIKEVRVQEVLLDALWASMRGVQTATWLVGLADAAAARREGAAAAAAAAAAANLAAEDFLRRLHSHLRAAGIREQDIGKFMPKLPQGPKKTSSRSQVRSLGRLLESFGVAPLYPDGPLLGPLLSSSSSSSSSEELYDEPDDLDPRLLRPGLSFAPEAAAPPAAAAADAAEGPFEGGPGFEASPELESIAEGPGYGGGPSSATRALQGYGRPYYGGPSTYPGSPYGYSGYGGYRGSPYGYGGYRGSPYGYGGYTGSLYGHHHHHHGPHSHHHHSPYGAGRYGGYPGYGAF